MVRKLLFLMTMSVGMIFPTIAQNVPAYVPTNGLVGWWPFNGNANDESGNGNHGTVNGATLTSDRTGLTNKAYQFNGTNNDIIIKNENQFDFQKEFTFSVWFKPSIYSLSQKFLISKFQNYDDSYSFGIENNKIDVRLASKKNGWQIYTDKNVLDTNQWYLSNFVLSNNNLLIFINGKLVSSKTFIDSIGNSSAPLVFGNFYGNNFYPDKLFNGKLDDIAIYNRALTQEEITSLYNGCNLNPKISNQTLKIGQNAQFFSQNISNTNFQWQTNPSQVGWQNLSNNIIYSGTLTNVLEVKNISLNNHNQPFRVIASSGNCIDTSNVALLQIADTCLTALIDTVSILKIKVQLTTGVKANQLAMVTAFPNPTSDVLVLEVSDIQAFAGYKYKMLDIQGKEVYVSYITNAKTEIALKSLGAKGVYLLHILDANNTSIENKKIVLE